MQGGVWERVQPSLKCFYVESYVVNRAPGMNARARERACEAGSQSTVQLLESTPSSPAWDQEHDKSGR